MRWPSVCRPYHALRPGRWPATSGGDHSLSRVTYTLVYGSRGVYSILCHNVLLTIVNPITPTVCPPSMEGRTNSIIAPRVSPNGRYRVNRDELYTFGLRTDTRYAPYILFKGEILIYFRYKLIIYYISPS